MMKDTEQLFEGWLSGNLHEEEIERLLGYIADGRDDGPWPTMIQRLLDDPGITSAGSTEQRDRLFLHLMERGRKKERVRTLRWIMAAAAVILLALPAGYWWFHKTSMAIPVVKTDLLPGSDKAVLTLGDGSSIVLDSSANGRLAVQSGSIIVKSANGQIEYQKADSLHRAVMYNTLSTPKGGQFKLVLPDGSLVWLNAASSITYPTAFTGAGRTVRVTGEAYFEVARNADAPFRVQVKDMDVQVLGTHFNINAYDDEASVNTTLLEGAVRVVKGEQQQLLQPGQQAQLPGSGGIIRVIPHVDEETVMAWKNGYFSFHHTSLPKVMRELARWYNVDIEYRGNIPDMNFGGNIPRSANASQVLAILQESKIHFVIERGKIIVMP